MGSKKKQPKKADTAGMLEFSPVTFNALIGTFRPLFPNRATVFLENTMDALAKGRMKHPPNRWVLARMRREQAA